MKKFLSLLILISVSLIYKLESKEKAGKKKKETCCPGVMWSTKEECKEDEGNFILNDKCCENSYLGKKDSPDQVCCGACTEDSMDAGVD